MARPSKLTPEVTDAIVRAVEAGTPIKYAAGYAGISEATVHRWMAAGEKSGSAAKYREFCEQVRRASARSVTRLVARVAQAADNDWRAAAWLLTRRAPQEFVSPERRGDIAKAETLGREAVLESERRIRVLERRKDREEARGRQT